MLDLSGGLTTDGTIRLCRRFEELDITCIEEPADSFDAGALKKISERVAIAPVMCRCSSTHLRRRSEAAS
jgi:galactonate dehydratase